MIDTFEKIQKILIFFNTALTLKGHITKLAEELGYGGKEPAKNLKAFLKNKGLNKLLLKDSTDTQILNESTLIKEIEKKLLESTLLDSPLESYTWKSLKIFVENGKYKKKKVTIICNTVSEYIENNLN